MIVVKSALTDNDVANIYALSVAKRAAVRMKAYRKQHENRESFFFTNIVRQKSEENLGSVRQSAQISARDLFDEGAPAPPPTFKSKCLQLVHIPVIPVGHRYKVYWDLFVVSFAVISLFITPICVAFPVHFDEYEWIVYSCDAAFFVDLVLNFREAYLDDDSFEVRDSKLVVKRYLYSWFVFDFLSTLPLEVLLSSLLSPKISRFLIYNRILRWLSLQRKTSYLFISELSRLVKLLLMFFYSAHLFACTFLAVSKITEGDRWIDIASVANEEYDTQYLVSLYWAFATIGTVGYGDIAPVNTYERGFAILCFFAGSVLYGKISCFHTF